MFGLVFTLSKREHTVSVRLSDVELRCYKRLLARHGQGFNDSDRFRSMLHSLDVADRIAAKAVVPHVETADERLDREDRERMRRRERVLFE